MEKKEKKVRVKKVKDRGAKVPMKERLGSLFFTVLALGIAVVVFAGFMLLQSVFSENIIYKEVLVVVQDIPEGEILTAENIGNYLGTRKVNELYSVSTAVLPEQTEQLIGMKTRVPMYVGEEVVPTSFTNVNVYLDYIENPVEMSIATGGIAVTDGGKIRAGDIVNITMMFTKEQLGMGDSSTKSAGTSSGQYTQTPSSAGGSMQDYLAGQDGVPSNETSNNGKGELGNLTSVQDTTSNYNFGYYAKYMLENIYIKEVLAADGSVISPTDTTTAASIFIVVVPKRIELQLNNIISNCSSMRISKVLYEISPDDLFKDSSLADGIANLEELPVDEEEVNASSEWTEPDEVGFRYKPNSNGTHMKWIDAGIIIEEDCEYDESGACVHCRYANGIADVDDTEGDSEVAEGDEGENSEGEEE